MQPPEVLAALFGVVVGRLAFPDNLLDEVVLSENLVEHHLDVVAGVPVAVVVEAAGLFEDAGEFDAAGAHEFDVRLGGLVAVFEGAALFGLSPEDFVVAIGVEGRIDVDEVYAVVGELLQLLQVVAAVDDARIDERRGLRGALGARIGVGHGLWSLQQFAGERK